MPRQESDSKPEANGSKKHKRYLINISDYETETQVVFHVNENTLDSIMRVIITQQLQEVTSVSAKTTVQNNAVSVTTTFRGISTDTEKDSSGE